LLKTTEKAFGTLIAYRISETFPKRCLRPKTQTMKTLITTIAIGLATLSAKANHDSALNLKMFDNGMFTVVLDEQPSYSPSRVFSVAGVQPGYHKLKVIRTFKKPHSYYTFSQVVYKGWINVPPRSAVYARIDCRSQLDVRVEPYFGQPSGGGYSNAGCQNENNYGFQQGCEGSGAHAYACMSHENFMQLKSSMASRSFEDSRMEIAKQALAYNYFTSTQIVELTHLFTFESNKLEFTKLAYAKTIDKQNYFLVNDAFTFENSISALNEYIAGR
jgi:hypothetical protein